MKKIIIAIATLLSMTTMAHAVPSLGVGSSTGYFNATDLYQTYWGGSINAASGQDGFAIGASGSSLHVWSNIMNADIYLLTTSDVANANNIKFNGGINMYGNTGTFRSYDPTPYYGIDLGPVNTSTWAALPTSPFTPGQFYSKDVTVAYSGIIGFDQWIFAAADTNGVAGLQAKAGSVWTEGNGLAGIQETETTVWMDTNGIANIQQKKGKIKTINGNWVTYLADTYTTYEADTFTKYQGDESSPKTTSARGYNPPNPVPEPGTIVLLGAGLMGLAIFGKRRMK